MEIWGHILLCSFSHTQLANPVSNTFSFSFRTWPKSDHSSLQPLRLPSANYSYFSPRIASKNVSLLSFLGASNSILNTAAKVILLKPKSDHDTLCSKFITTFPLHSDLKQIEHIEVSWTPFGWVGHDWICLNCEQEWDVSLPGYTISLVVQDPLSFIPSFTAGCSIRLGPLSDSSRPIAWVRNKPFLF